MLWCPRTLAALPRFFHGAITFSVRAFSRRAQRGKTLRRVQFELEGAIAARPINFTTAYKKLLPDHVWTDSGFESFPPSRGRGEIIIRIERRGAALFDQYQGANKIIRRSGRIMSNEKTFDVRFEITRLDRHLN